MTHRAKMIKNGLLSATLLSTIGFAAPGAFAQEMASLATTAPQTTQDSGDENEIVVTATRRSTSIQDTPINISAVTTETMQNQQLDDLRDLGAFIPGITIVDTGPRSAGNIIARGLTATSGGGSGAMGSYLGEIPLFLDFKLIDIDRVEVLLGPQGTLYGRGTLGGAIRYIPGRPNTDGYSYSARGRAYTVSHADNFGYSGEATINAPIIDDVLALRSSVGYYYDPGFIDYPYTVKTGGVSLAQPGTTANPLGTEAQRQANFNSYSDLNFERTVSTRNQLGLTVGEVKAYFTYAFQQTKTGGNQTTTMGVVGEGKYESAKRYREPGDRSAHLYAAELEIPLFGFAEIVSATGWTTTKRKTVGDVTDLLLDLDYNYELFPAFSGYTTGTGTTDQFNQEVRIVSKHGGPLSWILGGFYNNERSTSNSLEQIPGFVEYANLPANLDKWGKTTVNRLDANGNPIPDGRGGFVKKGYFEGLVRPDGAEYVSFTETRETEKAVFGEATFEITPKFQVTGGARYFEYDAYINGASDTPLTPSGRARTPYPSLTIAASRFRQGSTKDDGFVWKANTSYKFSPELMTYFTYSKGYRIGGVNRVAPCVLPLPPGQNLCALPNELSFGPDKTENFELGMRGEFFERRLQANLAVFNVNWDGIQLGSSTLNGAIGITANAGGARSRGVDFNFSARPIENLTITGNYSYLDAKLTVDAPGLVGVKRGSAPDIANGGLRDGKVDAFAGDRLPGSAKHTAALGATYTVPVGVNEMALNWTATYIGDRLSTTGTRGGGEKMPGYLMNRASMMFKLEKFDIGIYATNIFDAYAITGISQDLTRRNIVNDGVVARYYGRTIAQPRVVGVEARLKY